MVGARPPLEGVVIAGDLLLRLVRRGWRIGASAGRWCWARKPRHGKAAPQKTASPFPDPGWLRLPPYHPRESVVHGPSVPEHLLQPSRDSSSPALTPIHPSS